MENTIGALGGILFSGVTHTQAILEFETYVAFERRRSGPEAPSPIPDDDEEQKKVFVTMELFADRIGELVHTEQ